MLQIKHLWAHMKNQLSQTFLWDQETTFTTIPLTLKKL